MFGYLSAAGASTFERDESDLKGATLAQYGRGRRELGPAYAAYRSRTGMFVPRLRKTSRV